MKVSSHISDAELISTRSAPVNAGLALTLRVQQGRRLLDLRGGVHQPIHFGRNFRNEPNGVVFRSYFKKDADYRYRTRLEQGRTLGETNFSRDHFSVNLDPRARTFDYIPRVESDRRLIIERQVYPGRVTSSRGFQRGQPLSGLSGLSFVVPELCVDTQQNRLPDLRLGFVLERHCQDISEHQRLRPFADSKRWLDWHNQTMTVILRRLPSKRNANRAKLSAYLFTAWHDFFATDGLPFSVVVANQRLNLIASDAGLSIVLVQGKSRTVLKEGQAAPLTPDCTYLLGELVLEVLETPDP
ncbi:hypothetical protein SCOR_16620 [Sulfidibacter corallicola]|uniref:Uncharacterized protein n=1 Tax=Sulfidibacter corallicola TaxID=2818388 RepID=A0A8A4TXU1_SULCO|nr:hypothetical protein [Sulfidibacter corallicola]QTD53914.1 hypothetical protein J3U87_15810 [Sulfidibacter corallicola]